MTAFIMVAVSGADLHNNLNKNRRSRRQILRGEERYVYILIRSPSVN